MGSGSDADRLRRRIVCRNVLERFSGEEMVDDDGSEESGWESKTPPQLESGRTSGSWL